ncbi:hypothetical protein AXF42_Ash012874 [Apostasia shenzhenica]|uniref:Uncharacterized protein n=1 Tax=Apostasia shenzhenica TaxID=1088818 RepID=A0A2I0ARH2_9ASPA|nr:hypothetical protein AXF42_Ash012874 [Apostasia shenzhenica]
MPAHHPPIHCFSSVAELLPFTYQPMDAVWSWIAALPPTGDLPPSLPLATSPSGRNILLSAHRSTGVDASDEDELLLTFSVSLRGFHPSNSTRPLWLSEPIPLSASKPQLFLLLQLLNEVIFLAPSRPRFHLPKLDSEKILFALNQCPDSPSLLSLALLCRLFWLCSGEPPADAGELFFKAFDAALKVALDCRRSLRAFLLIAGVDREERFMRSIGYMLAKWCILRELQGLRREPLRTMAYAAEVYGLWVMRGYAPVSTMARSGGFAAAGGTPEAFLTYALAHQQLEAVVQLDYSVCGRDPRFLKVVARIDNIRLHVTSLGFGQTEEWEIVGGERHFPSRVRVKVGPEAGAGYAVGPSLGRSTGNPERVLESTRKVKGVFGFHKGSPSPAVRAKARWSERARRRSWRWEQEVEGSAAVFDGVLCNATTGAEVAGWRMSPEEGTRGGEVGPRIEMRRRYSGAERAFSKVGGVVVAGDELPEGVSWRVGREMEGKTTQWRLGGRVWVSYFPNEVRSGYFETRCVEWEEEVDVLFFPSACGC